MPIAVSVSIPVRDGLRLNRGTKLLFQGFNRRGTFQGTFLDEFGLMDQLSQARFVPHDGRIVRNIAHGGAAVLERFDIGHAAGQLERSLTFQIFGQMDGVDRLFVFVDFQDRLVNALVIDVEKIGGNDVIVDGFKAWIVEQDTS